MVTNVTTVRTRKLVTLLSMATNVTIVRTGNIRSQRTYRNPVKLGNHGKKGNHGNHRNIGNLGDKGGHKIAYVGRFHPFIGHEGLA